MTDDVLPTVGIATSTGNEDPNADAATKHHWRDVLTVAVVDGIGHGAETVEAAELIAQVATRVGARRRVLAGVLAATDLVADPMTEFPVIDAVMVLARCRAGQPTEIAYIGDCRAYGWDGVTLRQLTTDHTLGERMRAAGAPDDAAYPHDHKVLTSVARATVPTVSVTSTVDPVVVLLSDGARRRLTDNQLRVLIEDHADKPEQCAQAIIDRAREAGSTDDATVAVLTRPFRRNH